MDKRTYYVSVQGKTIMYNQGDAAYEFEIEATEEEVDTLRELFEEMEDFEEGTFIRSHVLAFPYHHDRDNDGSDYALKSIYALLSKLGTPETKEQIAKMDLDHIGSWS